MVMWDFDQSLPWLSSIRAELGLLAQTWSAWGATGLFIAQDGQCLWKTPANLIWDHTPLLKAPMRLKDGIFMLCVAGIRDARLQSRLYADAHLLVALIEREGYLDRMVTQAVSFQDQLLALIELNQSLSSLTALEHILHVIARQTHLLADACHTFVLVQSGAPMPEVAQVGENVSIGLGEMMAWHDALAPESDFHIVQLEQPHPAQLVAVPLTTRNGVIGILGTIKEQGRFLMPEIKLIQALADQGSIHIQKALLYRQHLSQERMATEMALARDVQMRLLPEYPPRLPGLDVWAHSNPALEVSGDFYDFELEGHTLHFVLGDVAGKGMSAALLMATSRTAVRVLNSESPGAMMAIFSQHLYDDFAHSDSFITLFIGYYDTELHILHYANAGHAPVIYCPAEGDPVMLEADCPPVGILEAIEPHEHLRHLAPNDLLVVTSDGIPEAQRSDGQMLGYETMMALIGLYRQHSAAEIGEMLLQAANSYQMPADDQTLVIIKRVDP